jgi:hypothetical protein
MAQDKDGIEYVTVVRVLEYYGPKKWVEETLRRGSVPVQGLRVFAQTPEGEATVIRSGVVQWEVEGAKVVPRQGAPYLPPPGGPGGN